MREGEGEAERERGRDKEPIWEELQNSFAPLVLCDRGLHEAHTFNSRGAFRRNAAIQSLAYCAGNVGICNTGLTDCNKGLGFY